MTKDAQAKIQEQIVAAGIRARAEAAARRNDKTAALPRELGGQKGLEPTRYGDWEKKGIISDF